MDNIIVWSLVGIAAAIVIIACIKVPSRVKECLLGWVVSAEASLGEKTGQVKLSMVYDMFSNTFPFFKNFVSFSTFSLWVDQALETMRHLLETNPSLNNVVTNTIQTNNMARNMLEQISYSAQEYDSLEVQ